MREPPAFCTVARTSTIPHARVLAHRIGEHHGSTLKVMLLGQERSNNGGEPFEVIDPAELAVAGFEDLQRDARWEDLKELLKPSLLRMLVDRGAERAVYLDPAIDVWAPLDPVFRELDRKDVVVAPRLLGDLPADGRRPDQRDLRRAGRFGGALVALSSGAVSAEIASWWSRRLTRSALSLPPASGNGALARRALSRWIDLAPSVFPDIGLLGDPGCAVSYWNLHERRLGPGGTGLTVDGRPLRFVHFEGFDPSRPFLLNADEDRIRTSENPALGELCASYADRLLNAGWRDLHRRSDVGRPLPNGILFDDRLSHLLAEAADIGEAPDDVFTEAGAETFTRWLEGPGPYGTAAGVNRYLYELYRRRPDLRAAYPDLDGPDGDGFMSWAVRFGADEMGIPDRFLPAGSTRVRLRNRTGASGIVSRRPTLPRGGKPDLSVNVTGLFTGTLGLGEAARGYVRALQAVDIPVSTMTVDVGQFVKVGQSPHQGYARVDYADVGDGEPHGFKLVCINPDELPRFAESVGDEFFSEEPVIGVWAWETDHIPQRWSNAFGLLDEIWVYSNYVAENLAREGPVPVHRVPPPVVPPDPGETKFDLGLPGGFQFLFMFDFFSTIQRKNPVGLIEAFRAAFEPGEGPQLVVKTINGAHRPRALEEVFWAARGRPDVHVIDRSLSARERDALVAGCDCYVSLHRSEGFGLTLAECMALGKPVIGTAFSAITDFMNEENSYLVSYEMTRVGADCEIYPSEGTWAEPDIDHAARSMRRVIEMPEEARQKGERARADIARLYSPRRVGELALRRLNEIRGLWR
jgi:glycosyltransferase involved in cell wall biosynthesis